MSDFHYEIETTNHYYLENFTVNGKSVQDGTPTPSNPVEIHVVQAPDGGIFGISVNGTIIPIDLQGNVLASLPDGTCDVLTIDDAGHCVLTKNIAQHTFNGSENWGVHAVIASWFYVDNLVPSMDYAKGSSSIASLSNTHSFIPYVDVGNIEDNQFSFGIVAMSNNRRFVVKETSVATKDAFKTWLASNNLTFMYPLKTPQTIDLGYIDVSNLKNIPEEIAISVVSTLNPETRYSYSNRPSYDVSNPYEDYNAPEYTFPPNHFGQEWKTFDANDWEESKMLDYTGQFESHAVYTIELCELMQSRTFDWKRPELDWSEAAYNEEQYDRFCKYFESRFMFREISILPPLQWFTALRRMLVYELMPKYKPLYEQIEGGLTPLGENEYYKRRHIASNYPETLLSGNSDYITTGDDEEFERVKVNNAAQAMKDYREGFASVDKAMADELEVLFVGMYTSYVNGL